MKPAPQRLRPKHWLLMLVTVESLMNPVQAANWIRVQDRDGIVIEQRDVAESELIWLAAETRVRAPPASLLALLMDLEHLSGWMAQYREAQLLQQVGVESFLVYVRVAAPYFLRDRDAIVASRVSWQQDVLRIGNRLDLSAYQPRADTVPMRALGGCWEVRSEADGQIALRYSGFADPAAKPAWLARKLGRDALLQTFRGLRRQLGLSQYQQAGLALESRYRDRLQRLALPEGCYWPMHSGVSQ